MNRWLYVLRALVIANLFVFVYFIITRFKYFKIYFYITATLTLSYVWFAYIRIFIDRLRDRKYPDVNFPYTVVVPCFNEERHLLIQTIDSLVNTDNIEKEIIIVDDGSLNGIWETIKELKIKYPSIKIFRFEKNKGKRFAHKLAIEQSTNDFIISIDSDTITGKNSIKNLLLPFSDKNVGAATGNILIKNEKKNILTRIQAGLYWIGLNVYKRGQSVLGNVICCSGCLSAYRKSDLFPILDEYVNQTYLGHECRASEDRYLTNLIKEKGKKIVYVEDSVCYTEAPTTLKKFIKQQIRWKRGFYRESFYTVTYSWKVSKLLWLENVLYSLITPVAYLTMVLTTIFTIIFYPVNFFSHTLIFMVLFVVFRDSLFFIEKPSKAICYIPYIFLFLFVLYPLNIYAIFNSKPENWGTR